MINGLGKDELDAKCLLLHNTIAHIILNILEEVFSQNEAVQLYTVYTAKSWVSAAYCMMLHYI